MAREKLTPEERAARRAERSRNTKKAQRQAIRDWFNSGGLLDTVRYATGEEGLLEHEFAAPTRRWRFDAAWPGVKVALEIDGGTWMASRGGHTSGKGLKKDREKANAAALRGWRVLRCDWDEVQNGLALTLVVEAICRVRKGFAGSLTAFPSKEPAKKGNHDCG